MKKRAPRNFDDKEKAAAAGHRGYVALSRKLGGDESLKEHLRKLGEKSAAKRWGWAPGGTT